jgi:hypothetical protein
VLQRLILCIEKRLCAVMGASDYAAGEDGDSVRVKLATASHNPWSHELRSELEGVAKQDCFGVHSLVDDPEAADIILFIDPHQHLTDWTMRAFRTHPLVQRWPRKVFIYDERDLPRDALPGVYVSMPRSEFDPGRHRAVSYYHLKNNTRDVVNEAPDLLFSFQGRRAAPVRAALLDLRHPRALIEDTSALNFFSQSEEEALEQGRIRYREIMGRSKFVLCPRGAGPSSFRLFEALSCGRVPVILSDEWVPPAGIDWDACSVRVPESEAGTLARRLEELEPQWPQMSAIARRTYDEWFSPESWFHRAIDACAELKHNAACGPKTRFWTNKAVYRDGARIAKGNLLKKLKSS